MKKIAYLITVSLIILNITTGCGKKKIKNENVKINTNENVIGDQKIDALSFTNTSLVYEDNTSIFKTLVTNNSKKIIEFSKIEIHIKDEFGKEIVVLPGYVGDKIESGQSYLLTASYPNDLTKAKSVTYEIIK